jgi:hypothetical protein
MSTTTFDIGKNPIGKALRNLYIFLGILVLSLIIITLFRHYKLHDAFFMLILAIALLGSAFMILVSVGLVIAGLANNGYYKAAKSAIESKTINPSYIIARDTFAGVVLVDDNDKKILVNKCGVRDFADVKELSVKSVTDKYNNTIKTLTIIFKSGANPIETVILKSGEAGDSQYHRLSNSLGFSSL